MNIQLLQREEIDKTKWNSCIHYATNGSIFGYMWYLDATARHWDALVAGDYESVMPLPYQRLGLRSHQLYQPNLIREMAIYSIHSPAKARVEAFWKAIPDEYKKVDITVDTFSAPESGSWRVMPHSNYYLPLTEPYERLRERYTPERVQALEAVDGDDYFPTTSIKPERLAALYRQMFPLTTEQEFHGLQRIMYNVLHRGWGFATGIMDRDKNVLAADFLIYSHGRVMSLAPIETPEGEKMQALAYLYDLVIRNHAGKPQALDFNIFLTGDELALGFGAVPYTYHRVKRDRRRLGILGI